MFNSYPNWVEKYASVIYNLLQSHDAQTHLPFNGFNFYPLFDDLWIDKIYQAIKKFNEMGLKIEEIIEFLPTHSSLKFNLFEIIIDLKTSNTDFKKAKIIVDFFISAIKARALNGDDWMNDNKIKIYKDAEEFLSEKNLIKANKDLSSEVAKIIAGCGTLVHGLYNDYCTDYGYDVFGPYNLPEKFGENATLFIRQFADLKGEGIWPERSSFPYKKIKIHTVYNNLESQSYYIGCHMVYKQSLVENLAYFQVQVDNTLVNSLKELKILREVILKNASQHYVMYKKLGFEDYKRIWLWQLCYQFKNFFTKVGIDWKPSQGMINRVRNKELADYMSNYDFTYNECCEKIGINYLRHIYGK